MKRFIVFQYAVIVISLVCWVVVWEFSLEDILIYWFMDHVEPETLTHRVKIVVTVLVFALLSLIFPFVSAWRMEGRRMKMEAEREVLVADLRKALGEVKTLQGIIPICMYCKRVLNDEGMWGQIEAYIRNHSEAEFSHGICPECYYQEGKE